MTSNWLSLVPVCDGFAYNAAMICEDCAAKTIEKLQTKGVENTGDSNDFPQGPYPYSETDSPDHCDNGEHCVNAIKIPGTKKIGCPLSCQLTKEGADYVRIEIAKNLLYGTPHQKAVGRLWLHLFKDSVENDQLIPLIIKPVPLPPPLRQSLESFLDKKEKHTQVIPEIFTDLEYVYGGVVHDDKTPSLCLWRVPIGDLGEFGTAEGILLPINEIREQPLVNLITSAISELAWD